MILQVQDILKDAMGLIGVIEIDETPSASDMSLALRVCNMMLDRWSSQRLMLRSETEITFTLTGGKAEYTIGPVGCDITTPRILSVQSGYVTDAQTDHPIEIITRTLYDTMEDKNVSTSRPIYVAFEAGAAQQAVPKGTLFFYYTPDKNYPVLLQCDTYLNEFVNFTDTVTFEPAYYECIVYNLAVRLFRFYNTAKMQIPPDIVMIANNSLSNIKTLNNSPIIAAIEVPGKMTRYNIYTDNPN